MTMYGGERLFCEECDVTLLEECGYTTPQAGICDDCLAKIEAQPVIDALHQLRDVTAEYPEALLSARRAAVVAQIQKQNDDPRTAEQIDMDEWQADARATRESDRPQ